MTRNRLNFFLIEVKRDQGQRMPFFIIIGRQQYRFSLPGWWPWWLGILVGLILVTPWLFVWRGVSQMVQRALLWIMFVSVVWFLTLCQNRCMENVSAIVEAAKLTVYGLPKMAAMGA